MTPDEIRSSVLRLLGQIAPEADLSSLPDDADLREELDLDSMDFLRLVTAVHQQLGISIPEADYRRIATLGGCVGYLAEHGG